MSNIHIRQENPDDYSNISSLIQSAFQHHPHSDQTEHIIVDKIRNSPAYIPELSLVLYIESQLVGYLIFSKASFEKANPTKPIIALGPICIHPEFQKKGLSYPLLNTGHCEAKDLGYLYSVLVGNPEYYKKFGYQNAMNYQIDFRFNIPSEYFMIKALGKASIESIKNRGILFAQAFY